MPISDNISREIKRIKADSIFKDLMMEILTKEDEGLSSRTYKAEYKAIVDAFINKTEENNGSDPDQSN